jgi:glycerol-3-phosphate dehydrogenase (NAD(P)+)
MTKITIIGAGEIGRAIEKVLKKKSDISIEIWDKDESKVPNQKDLASIVESASFLFMCVPSWVMEEAVKNIEPHLKEETIVISPAKGIDKETQKTIDEVLGAQLSRNNFAIMHGPMIAEELMRGMGGYAVIASKNKEVPQKVANLFERTKLKLELSNDTRGTALAGVLKNIYAVGLGITDGLELGMNFKGWYVGQAIKEMGEIIGSLGGKVGAALSLAGASDLIATGFSENSRNHKVGFDIAQKGDCELESEGTISLPSIIKLLGDKPKSFPVLIALEKVVIQNKEAKEIFNNIIV